MLIRQVWRLVNWLAKGVQQNKRVLSVVDELFSERHMPEPAGWKRCARWDLKVGDPCLIQLDVERRQLLVRQISGEKAVTMGWRIDRKRRTG